MLKKVILATAATGLIALIAVPVQTSPAEAQMTCQDAAKKKHPDDMNAQQAYLQECTAAWKKSQAAKKKPAAEPTYAGDL
jgi:hypothetical protein